jgi:hypothetical protein
VRKRQQKQMQMQISEAELAAMTRDVDEAHRATLPRMYEAIAELREGRGTSRRGFLFGAAGLTAGAVLIAACGSDDKSSTSANSGGGAVSTGSSSAGSGGGGKLTGDLAIEALSASLENLAVQTYQAGLDAATAGKLGTVPPALANFAKTAQSHHKDHAAAWNAVLTGAGKPAVTGIDKTVQDAVVTPGFAKVTNGAELAKFALGLEDAASATYLNAIQNAIQDSSGIMVAATIQPVEMQHAAILHFVLGEYPVPDTFAKTDGARGPDDVIA